MALDGLAVLADLPRQSNCSSDFFVSDCLVDGNESVSDFCIIRVLPISNVCVVCYWAGAATGGLATVLLYPSASILNYF